MAQIINFNIYLFFYCYEKYSILQISSLFIIVSFVVLSCSRYDESQISPSFLDQEVYNLNDEVKVKSSTTKLSPLFDKLGVSEIKVTDSGEKTFYDFSARKAITLNGSAVDFLDYPVYLEGNKLFLR